MSKRAQLAVWADADQAGLVEQAIRAAPVELAAVGSPDVGTGAQFAKALGAGRAADLREMVHDNFDVLWLASRRPLDASTRKLLSANPRRIVCCEPVIGTLGGSSNASPALTVSGGRPSSSRVKVPSST